MYLFWRQIAKICTRRKKTQLYGIKQIVGSGCRKCSASPILYSVAVIRWDALWHSNFVYTSICLFWDFQVTMNFKHEIWKQNFSVRNWKWSKFQQGLEWSTMKLLNKSIICYTVYSRPMIPRVLWYRGSLVLHISRVNHGIYWRFIFIQ
jgi:hypothetical protein